MNSPIRSHVDICIYKDRTFIDVSVNGDLIIVNCVIKGKLSVSGKAHLENCTIMGDAHIEGNLTIINSRACTVKVDSTAIVKNSEIQKLIVDE